MEHPKRRFLRKSSTLKDSYRIENGGSTQFMVESNIEKIFERSQQDMVLNTNKVRVLITHDVLDIEPLTGIDIDKPKTTGYRLQGSAEDGSDLAKLDYFIYSIVKIENSKKIITLTSRFRLSNSISRPYSILLESNGQTFETTLETNASSAIPLDYLQGTLAVRLDLPGGVESKKIPIKEFLRGNNNVVEIQTGDSYVFAKCTKDLTTDFYDITLLPPFEIKNCCGLELTYKFSNNIDKNTHEDIDKLKPQESVHETRWTLQQPVYIQVRLQGYLWSNKFLVNSPDPKAKLAKEILVRDALDNPLNILLFIPKGEIGTKKLFLYTKTCIVNETPYDLLCYTMDDKKRVPIPGQYPMESKEVFNSKVTLFNETKSLIFGRKKQKEFSKPVNVGTMGSTAAELLNENKTTMLDLGVNMSLLRCDKKYNLITKIITLSPRFIFINKTNYPIEVKREQGEQPITVLEKDVRTPLYWTNWANTAKDKSISVRPVDNDHGADFWSWTHGFDIQAVGLYNYLLSSKDKKQSKFLKTVVNLEYSTIFVIIEEENPEQLPFKVRNDCPNVDIVVYQSGTSANDGLTLRSGETAPWAWVYPNKKKEVLATFSLESVKGYLPPDTKFSFDSLNTLFKAKVPVGKDKKVIVYASVAVEGSTRVLKFFIPGPGLSSTKRLLYL